MKAGPDLVNTFEQRPARYLKSRVEWIGKTCIDFTGWLSYYQINFVSANLWLCFTLTGRIENKDTKKTTPHIHVGRGVGLARTIYIRFTYGIFGLEITKYTVYLYVYIRFWPTLQRSQVGAVCRTLTHKKSWSHQMCKCSSYSFTRNVGFTSA
jgi:hypothetical protein